MDGKYLLPVFLAGHHHLYDIVEAARPEDRGVQNIQTVGRPQDENPPEFVDAVELGQELAQDPFGDMGIRDAGAPGRNEGIDFIEKDDAGRRLSGLCGRFPGSLFPTPRPISTSGRVP